ncbi:MAG TPA: DEAD/DEAH box helicase [Saprospiraceae bacterium]|nr:DEAD/DEAH box helicase [Saprospiraceae bacterium]
MNFIDLKLIQPLLDALHTKGYTRPTPIQIQSIPYVLEGRDLFGCAQTGTGKTAAFALPLLQIIHENKTQAPGTSNIQALILAPTRELALQIHDSFKDYGNQLSLRTAVIFGGVSQEPQTKAIKRGIDILIATPGRLLDLIQQGHLSLRTIKHFVLDEADRMLDMGFIHDIKRVIAMLPAKKQTLFFSATAAPEIMQLANGLLHQPAKVSVSPVSSTADQIEQAVYYVDKEDKRSLLKHVLKNGKVDHALVFTRTKRGADRVARELNKSGIKAEAIHGNKSQGARERALVGFKNRSIKVLVATDIASRGIDVDKLSHVINFEIPEQPETYVHRIGRTGRAERSGIAWSFCAQEERTYLNDIHKLIRKNIDVIRSHPFAR